MFKFKTDKNKNEPLSTLDSIELDNASEDLNSPKSKKTKSKYGAELLPGSDRAFFELFSIHANSSKKWYKISMVALAITALALVNDKISGGTKYVPVLITQSEIGQLTPLGTFQSKSLKVDEKVVIGQIYTYLNNLRSVVQDVKIEKNRRKQLILLTTEKDQDKINKLFLQQLADAGQDTISVEVTQIMPIRTATKTSWKVQWVETYGNTPNISKRYEAIFNTDLQEVTTNNPEEIALNPTGLVFSNFTMSQVFDGTQSQNNTNSDNSNNN